MSSDFAASVDVWTAELKAGVPADQVIASMASVLAERLSNDIYEYDPTADDLETLLEAAQDDKRNPMLTLGEEIAGILNKSESAEIFQAVQTLASFQEMVAEFDGDDEDDEPDYAMIAGDALVEEALELVPDIWAERRENPAAKIPRL